MAQMTEAACLLQSGAMYFQRLGLKPRSGEPIFAGVKPGAVSIYFGDAPIYHFDLEGRWQRAFVDGMHYLKGLDATTRSMARERSEGGMVLRRSSLPYAETADLDASIRSMALGLIDDLDSGRLEILGPPSEIRTFSPEGFRSFLERVSAWDSAAWFAHRERYLGTYGPLPFLPPDCLNALILQATLGHESGRAFGGARPAEHYVRSLEEFRGHVEAVAALTGRRVAQNRGIFLGGADVLRRPTLEILNEFQIIEEVFTRHVNPFEGDRIGNWDEVEINLGNVHAFLDEFGDSLPDLEGWRSLKAARLGQVTLGLESGDPTIRSAYGREWEDIALKAVVRDLKNSEIRVGMVVLVGAGGRPVAERHLDSTASLLDSLPLEAGDLVTLVDARSLDGSSGKDVDPLGDEEITSQITTLKERPARARPSKGPKVVVYNPDKRWT